jgi:hypothetical protein
MHRVRTRLRSLPATLRTIGCRLRERSGLIERDGERGQTTAEYALVLLGAAGVALLLLGWATQSGAIGQLFDAVMDGVIGKVL